MNFNTDQQVNISHVDHSHLIILKQKKTSLLKQLLGMVPVIRHVGEDVEDNSFGLVDLAYRELIFENEVNDEVDDDEVMMRSIRPTKLLKYSLSRRKCHLSGLYSLSIIAN